MMEPRYRIGFLMDPYETLNLATETSLLCMDELMARGHEACWLEQEDLSLVNGKLMAMAQRVGSTMPFRLEAGEQIEINRLDALVIRKDPPFDTAYLHLTYLLEFLDPGVLQINSPAALRNLNEKIVTQQWAGYCPDSMISSDVDALVAFTERHEKTVLKPLDDCSGRGISILDRDDADRAGAIRGAVARHGYVLAQQFLPAVANGDKRVYLVNGSPVGWVNRIPATESHLANIHQGASCRQTILTERERQVSEEIGRYLTGKGVLLAGLDFIGEQLTEINITSPSAVRQINEVEGIYLERTIVDGVLAAVAGEMLSRPDATGERPCNPYK